MSVWENSSAGTVLAATYAISLAAALNPECALRYPSCMTQINAALATAIILPLTNEPRNYLQG